MTRVHVVSCGGTIASEPAEGGAAPAKTGADLVEAVPRLSDHAEVTAETVGDPPGFDVDFETVAAAGDAARRAVESGADGVVLTHGTDTLADTAFALDCGLDLDAPVVVTGAQRRFDEVSSDAPANLLAAVRVAGDDRFASGVHVAFDEVVHAARDVVKGHTSALSTFESPDSGPVASLTRERVRLHREPRRRSPALPWLSGEARGPHQDAVDVPVVHSGTGVGAAPFERALAGDVDGVVVEGTGLGNVTGALGDAIAAAPVPVVVASRCHAGHTEQVYGTAGGGVTLREHGALFAGDLPAAKARVTLVLALAAGLDSDELASVFD